MIIDSLLLFSDAQAVTSAAGSTNTIDMSEVRDIGNGEPLYIVVTVDVATDAGKTVAVALEGDSTTTFTPDGTVTMFTMAAATAAGTVFVYTLQPGSDPLQYRYLRLLYTPSSALTDGTFTAFLTNNYQRATHYADNITITG